MPKSISKTTALISAEPANERQRTKRTTRKSKPVSAAKSSETASVKIDRLIAGTSDWRGEVLTLIRRTMLEADPDVTEDWKWMGSPVWYCGGMIAVANAHRDKVKCTFSKGAHLLDQDSLFNAGLAGNEWRAIDVFEKDVLDAKAFARLVATSIAYNKSRLGTAKN